MRYLVFLLYSFGVSVLKPIAAFAALGFLLASFLPFGGGDTHLTVPFMLWGGCIGGVLGILRVVFRFVIGTHDTLMPPSLFATLFPIDDHAKSKSEMAFRECLLAPALCLIGAVLAGLLTGLILRNMFDTPIASTTVAVVCVGAYVGLPKSEGSARIQEEIEVEREMSTEHNDE